MGNDSDTHVVRLLDKFQRGEISRRQFLFLATGVVGSATAAALLVSCGEGETPTAMPATPSSQATSVPAATPSPPSPTVGGTLRCVLTKDPESLDPVQVRDVPQTQVFDMLFDKLVTYAPDGSFAPSLAESWTVSDDGLVWDFKIKQGVKFHDGTPLTAQDCAWTFERYVDPELQSPIVYGLFQPVLTSAEVVDDSTLRLNTSVPFAPMLMNLALYCFMCPQAYVEDVGWQEFAVKPMGSGPWKFVDYEREDHVTLERNPDYQWGPAFLHTGSPYIEEVFFKVIPEREAAIAALEAGEVDFAMGPFIETKNVPTLEAAVHLDVLSAPVQGLTPWALFNVQSPHFSDVRVRQAVNLALNRQEFIDLLGNGSGTVAYGPITPTMDCYWEGVEQIGYGYDAERAEELLAEAGWTDSDGDGIVDKDGSPFEVDLLIAPEEIYVRNAELFQAQLAEVGIKLNIKQLDQAVHYDTLNNHDFEISLMTYYSRDIDLLYVVLHSQAPMQWGDLRDSHLDELLDQQRVTVDTEERCEVVAEIQQYMVEQAYYVPIWIPDTYFVFDQRLQGYVWTAKLPVPYWQDAYIEE